MTDEVLATLVGILGGALLAIATLAGAFMWRRLQEARDAIRELQIRFELLTPILEETAGRARAKRRQSRAR